MGIVVLILAAIVLFGIIIPASNEKSEKEDIINSQEFQEALARARRMKSAFEELVKLDGGGSVFVTEYDIDSEEPIDHNMEEHSGRFYYRVEFENAYSSYLFDKIKNSWDEERDAYLKMYYEGHFGKTVEEIEQSGLDAIDIVYDMKPTGRWGEGLLYYPFYCPCGLKGSRRRIFVDAI